MTVAGGSGGDSGSGEDGGASHSKPPDKPPSDPNSVSAPRPGTPGRTADGGKPSSDSCDPDDQEDDEILEESPCKRWSKRREKVKQRDVPGIDAAYLAMDNETGNEVVWNEVLFSERKNFREQEEKIRAVFDNLIRLEHPNLVKFHKYWMDTKSDKPRIIFITEYMSSGSMSRFLQRARSSGSLLNIKAWKSWTRQILSALSYLHSCDPPIVHANLTCNTVFIQQNGLVKIGCVAPKTIHHHVKTFRENIKNVHYLAPEYDHQTEATTQADIYSFGVCALEMATTGALQGGSMNGGGTGSSATVASASNVPEKEKSVDSTGGGLIASSSVAATTTTTTTTVNATGGGGGFHMVTEEMVHKALCTLEDSEQKQFIERCLEHNPANRANVIELLNRLGPPEPDKNEPLDDDGFEQRDEAQTIAGSTSAGPGSRATSPPQRAQNVVDGALSGSANSAHPSATQQPSAQQHAIASMQTTALPSTTTASKPTTTIAQKSQPQDGYSTTHHHFNVSATTVSNVTTSANVVTTVAPTASTTSSISTTSKIGTIPAATFSTLTPTTPNNVALLHTNVPDEGYHTNQSMVDVSSSGMGGVGSAPGHADTIGAIGVGVTSSQHRETRQIMQLHAELLDADLDGSGVKLRVQLQLDDSMNRQLTTQLREDDTGESLANELVQHGFVSEANSMKMCKLLTEVLSHRHDKQRRSSTDLDSAKEEAPLC